MYLIFLKFKILNSETSLVPRVLDKGLWAYFTTTKIFNYGMSLWMVMPMEC